jgi:hypothetical protein
VDNTAVGYQAGLNITTGTQNTALGSGALAGAAGARNTEVGYAALSQTTGAFNTAVGRQALSNNTTANSNTAIGENCQSGNFSGSVILGKDATATAANQFVVGSTGTNAGAVNSNGFLIGANSAWNVKVNGTDYNIPVATTSALAKLQVVGSGATSSTTSLLVQNSNTSSSLAVLDNGAVGIGLANPSASLHVKGSGSTSATTSLLVQNSAGTEAVKVFDHLRVDVRAEFRVLDSAGNNAMIMYGDGFSGTKTLWVAGSLGLTGSPGNNASARLQVDSTTQGFLPPRMTTTQRNAIASPAAGLVVYDTTLAKLCVYTTAWETITSV